jgi:hypothetical protein
LGEELVCQCPLAEQAGQGHEEQQACILDEVATYTQDKVDQQSEGVNAERTLQAWAVVGAADSLDVPAVVHLMCDSWVEKE